MKRISLMIYPALLAGLYLFSCNNAPETEINTAPRPDTIRVVPAPVEGAAAFRITEGTVFWQGKKSLGSPHNGIITVSGGELQVNQGQIVGGNVTLDMSSIAVTNLNDAEEKADLESHLKDKDFFEVRKFQHAEFVITEILPSVLPDFNWVVRGNLTIKEKSNPVNIPVKVRINGDNLEAQSVSFLINRTKWGINFRSGILGTAEDKIVEDVVPLSLRIKAKKNK